MELTKKVIRVGNSAGVILPREWYGGEAKVELVKKPLNIEEDVLKILKLYLKDILGIYIVGSYARGEETENSDVDIIAISKDIKKEISYGKYNISIYTLESVEKTLTENPVMIAPRLMEARAIFNENLLQILLSLLKKIKVKEFIEDTKRIIKINKGLLELEREEVSDSIIYSLILRLRAVFLIKNILDKKLYSKKLFSEWIIKEIKSKEDLNNFYFVYEAVRDNKKTKIKIKVSTAERLLQFLENEVKKLENKKWRKEKKG